MFLKSWYRFFMIIAMAALGVIVFFTYFASSGLAAHMENEDEAHLNVLMLSGAERGPARFDSGGILVIYKARPYLHIYRLNPVVSIVHGKRTNLLLGYSAGRIASELEDLLGQEIHYTVSADRQGLMEIIETLGGTEFFNVLSSDFPFGPVYINTRNYTNYISSIQDDHIRRDVEFSLWINMVRESFLFFNRFGGKGIPSGSLYAAIDTDLSRKDFRTLIGYLVNDITNVYFSHSRMNVDRVDGDEAVRLPADGGRKDALSLLSLVSSFTNEDMELRRFPLTLQVKNSTPIPRLGAKTSGILRMKKCDVREYLNAKFKLTNSVLIDRSGSVVKREYLKKITKVDRVYFTTDYREQFDFTVYLGEDYYANKFFR